MGLFNKVIGSTRKSRNRIWRACDMWYSYQLKIQTLRAPGLSHITRRKVTSPNGIARWRKVTSHGGKSHHFATIPMAQRHSTENRKVTKSSRDTAHSEIFVDYTSAKPTMLLHTKRKCYMNCCRIWKKTSKHCGHTGWIRRHKDCKWKLKINKVLRTTAKMIHELVLHTSKSHQNKANYESTKYSNEKSKSNKVLRTTAKMMHELLPDRKKVMETLRARRMIRLLPVRYDLNRPLVSISIKHSHQPWV